MDELEQPSKAAYIPWQVIGEFSTLCENEERRGGRAGLLEELSIFIVVCVFG